MKGKPVAEKVAEKKRKAGRPKKSEKAVEVEAAASKTAPEVAAPPKKTRRPRKTDWPTLRAKVDESTIVEYSMKIDYSEITAISHKKFGIGVITKILDDNKIQVVFEENTKVLAQNWEA